MAFTLIHGDDLHAFPTLRDEMFWDRGSVFKDRLGWDLETDEAGRELDAYDGMNPLYNIVTDEAGRHLGSTRLMPTTGPTMIADHFADLTGGVPISSATIWEVTRFFVSPKAGRRTAPALMWAGCDLAHRSGVNFYVGVTGAHMVRVFSACGWTPEVIGRGTSAEGDIVACLWEVSAAQVESLRVRAGLPEGVASVPIHRPTPLRAKAVAPALALAA